MSNSYYNHGSYPTTGAPGASASLRSELDSITSGFNLLPTISGNGNKAVVVNSGATALTVTTGTLALAGNFATTGAYNTTLIQGATTSLTLPLVSGTLATLAGTEEFTNKTLTSSVGKGTWTTSGTWILPALTLGGAITYGGVTLSNAVTGTGNMVLSASPTLTGTIAAASQTLSGTLGVTGVATFTAQPIMSSLTASKPVFTDASKGLTSTGTLAYDQGGTGQTSYAAGDIVYASGVNTLAKLTIGTTGQRLVVAAGLPSWATDATIGTVTSVGWTGGIVSVATATTTPAFTIAGTSGGIPYFASASTWATSAALAANALVLGGGAGAAPATTTTGTGVVTALGVNTGSAGAMVLFDGALGTPTSGTATNLTGLPLTTGVTGTLPVANGGTGLASGTSGGVLAYTATGTLASSAALAASALVLGGGAGAAPATTTTGTGVVTALGVNTGTAGAFVVNGGALGSPSSAGTIPAFTLGGTVAGGGNQLNNVIIGTTTPLAGAFTTLSATGQITCTRTSSLCFLSNGATTSESYGAIVNGSGGLYFGVESSAGGIILGGTSAYAGVVGTFNNTPVQIASNNAVVGTFSSTAVTLRIASNNTLVVDSSNVAVNGTLSATGTSTLAAINASSGIYAGYGSDGAVTSLRSNNGTGNITNYILRRGDGTGAFGSITSGGGGANDVTSVSIGIGSGGAIAQVSSTGLAVTGTLSATAAGDVANFGNTKKLYVSSDSAGFGLFSGAGQTNTGIYASDTSNFMYFATSSTERMRLDSSGNLGLGVTPSAWWGNMKAVQVGGSTTSIFAGAAVNTNLVSNAYYDGTNWKYVSTGFASEYEQTAGAHKWYSVASGTAATNLAGGVSGANFATAAMTLDASGNLLVGVTANTGVDTGVQRLVVTGIAAGNGGALGLISDSVGRNIIITDSTKTYVGAINISTTQMAMGTNSAIPLLFLTNSTERARIDSSGSLLLGPTSSTGLSGGDFAMKNASSIRFRNAADNAYVSALLFNSSNGLDIGSGGSLATITFGIAGVGEVGRFDTSGRLLVGTPSVLFSTAKLGVSSAFNVSGFVHTGSTANAYVPIIVQRTASVGSFIDFVDQAGSSAIGSIATTNNTTVAYNTSSDYRLKENVQPMTSALATVAALKPVTFNWKSDGSAGQGFIAHELQAIVPDCVAGEKDAVEMRQYEISPAVPATFDEEGNELTAAVEAVMGEREVPRYQGIDTSFLVATLTAAIQEQQAIITALTTRITALENK